MATPYGPTEVIMHPDTLREYQALQSTTKEHQRQVVMIGDGRMLGLTAALLAAATTIGEGGQVALAPPRQTAMEALRELEQRDAIRRGLQTGMTEIAQEYAAMQAAAAYQGSMNRRQRRAAAKKGRRVERKP